MPIEREVVRCNGSDGVCGTHAGGDNHGWGCPLSDPAGDVLRAMGERPTNPLLAEIWDKMQARWLNA